MLFKHEETADEDVSLDDCWFIKFIAVFTPAFIRRVCPMARSGAINEQKHIYIDSFSVLASSCAYGCGFLELLLAVIGRKAGDTLFKMFLDYSKNDSHFYTH